MEEKRTCKIVQDLLPNYIEKLTNEETNNFIEEHLKNCKECKNMLESMQKEISLDDKKRDDREVQYIKKYSKKMKILKTIILLIIFIYLLLVARRTVIMVSLSKKAYNNLLKDNYYARLYSHCGDTLRITDSYNKGDNYLTTMTVFENNDQINKITFYEKDDEKICLTQVNDKKYLLDAENIVGMHILPVTDVLDGFLANLQYALVIGIDSTYCNGRECYVIKGKNYERFVDKETGLLLRSIQKAEKNDENRADTIVDYEYKFDVVEDSNIVKPDISGAIAR